MENDQPQVYIGRIGFCFDLMTPDRTGRNIFDRIVWFSWIGEGLSNPENSSIFVYLCISVQFRILRFYHFSSNKMIEQFVVWKILIRVLVRSWTYSKSIQFAIIYTVTLRYSKKSRNDAGILWKRKRKAISGNWSKNCLFVSFTYTAFTKIRSSRKKQQERVILTKGVMKQSISRQKYGVWAFRIIHASNFGTPVVL